MKRDRATEEALQQILQEYIIEKEGEEEEAEDGDWSLEGLKKKNKVTLIRRPFYSRRNIEQNQPSQKTKQPIKILYVKKKRYSEDIVGKVGVVTNEFYIVTLRFRGKLIRVLFDTGSNVTIIDSKFVEKVGWKWNRRDIELCYATKEAKAFGEGFLTKDGYLEGADGGIRINPIVANLEGGEYDMILGNPDLLRMGITLGNMPQPRIAISGSENQDLDDEVFKRNTGVPVVQLHKLTKELEDLLMKNEKVTKGFCTTEGSLVTLKVEKGKVEKIKSAKHNYIPFALTEEVRKTVNEWLENGVIKKYVNRAPINLALLAVKQTEPSGEVRKIRVCLDLRPLNGVLDMDYTVIPTITELTRQVAGKKVFSSLDLKAGYHQFKVKEEDQKYLAFTFDKQQYVFTAAPFGLSFLPSQFHKVISAIMQDIPQVVCYLDDIAIATDTVEEHIEVLKKVLGRLNKNNLTLNRDKCTFMVDTITFLGFRISKDGIQVDEQRRSKLINTPEPTTSKDLKSWLAAYNFIRKHIPGFGAVAGELFQLSNEGKTKLQNMDGWVNGGRSVFYKCKERLQQPATLRPPIPGVDFWLETDASDYGYGGALFQLQDDGTKRYIEFFSGAFKRAERSYSIPKKEMAALMKGIKHFHHYLYGAKFNVLTDSQALTYLDTMEPQSAIIDRWFGVLGNYNFKITHIAGKQNQLPDLLSRLNEDSERAPINSESESGDEEKKEATSASTRRQVNQVRAYTDDWALNMTYFNMANKKWGPFTVDGFASITNRRLKRHVTKQQDFFKQSWSNKEKLWLNPPWKLITETLSYLTNNGLTAVMVVPFYPDASWWLTFEAMVQGEPLVIPKRDDVFLKYGQWQYGKTPWEYTVVAQVATTKQKETQSGWLEQNAEQLARKTVQAIKVEAINNTNKELYIKVNSLFPQDEKKKLEKVEKKIIITNEKKDFLSNEELQRETKSIDGGANKNKCMTTTRRASQPTQEHGEPITKRHKRGEEPRVTEELSATTKAAITKEYHRFTHSNQQQMKQLMEEVGNYQWTDLEEHIAAVDNKCWQCEVQKVSKVGRHPLTPITAEAIGEIWVIDLFFFGRSIAKDGKQQQCLLHIVDKFSSFSIVKVVKNKTAEAVARALMEAMLEHGFPILMIHDNGGEFCNKLADRVFQELGGILRHIGSSYKPQTQGANERMHRKMKELLRGELERYGFKWIKAVPLVIAMLNNSITRRHNKTPFQVYYGRTNNNLPSNKEFSVLTHQERLLLMARLVYPEIKNKIAEVERTMKMQYDKLKPTLEFQVGDIVKVKQVENLDSIASRFKGPYRIQQKVMGGYMITNYGDTTIANDTPIPPEQLAFWKRTEAIENVAQGLTAEKYEIKRILEQIREDGITWYKVLWGTNETTWEPETAFEQGHEAIIKFVITHNKAKRKRKSNGK